MEANKISLFGAGFIGGVFASSCPIPIEIAHRAQIASFFPDILDFVSTIDNYNVKTNCHIDIDTNLGLLINKLEMARKIHGTKTIYNFVSSWFVYGKTEIPAKETSPCNPTGFYSITKRCAEQLLISYCETFDMKYRILRLGNVIGVGDTKISRKKNALQYMIKELAQGREVELYQNGAIRDYIDVRDVCRAILLVLERGELNQIYNIANGQGLNVADLTRHSHALSGYSGRINVIKVPEFHRIVQTPKMYLDISKIKKLGYVKQHDIKTSIGELVAHYKNE